MTLGVLNSSITKSYNIIIDPAPNIRSGVFWRNKMSIFEALMMLGFGLAWPFNIYKSVKTKTAAGKSFAFMITIELAYLCGVIHKIFYNYDAVIWLYVANFVMVFIDLMLMIRNRKLDLARAQQKQPRTQAV